MFCKFLLNNLSRTEAKEQLGWVQRFAIVSTVVSSILFAFHVKEFGLDKPFGAKLYHAVSVLIGMVLMAVIWNLYFCFRQRAAEGE